MFHMAVVSLLFSLKRARPDILVLLYLCTCARSTMKRNEANLLRLLGYLEGLKEAMLVEAKENFWCERMYC
jgi:hypothetical protein